MSDIAIVPATETAPETQALPAPTSFAAVKARILANTEPAPTPAPETSPEAPATTDIDVSDADLANFTQLTKQNRELKQQAQAQTTHSERITQAEKLMSEGRSLEAIRVALGETAFDAAVKEAMNVQDTSTPVDPVIKALQDEIKTLKDTQTKTQEQLDAEAKAKAEAQKADGVKRITAEVTANASVFPYLAEKTERVTAALQEADKAYEILKADKKRDLTDAEKNTLIRAALEEAEEEHANKAKEYGATPKARVTPAAKPASAPTPKTSPVPAKPTFNQGMRGSIAPSKATGPKTFQEVKAALLNRAASN
jgi:hypothetical protein